MNGIMGTKQMVQVGFVVKDIETTKIKFAKLFDVAPPDTISANRGEEHFHVTQTNYLGQPCPKADAKLAFFEVGGAMAIELIEPNEEPSVWRDWLDKHGEGIHHLAFVVKDMDQAIKACEGFGMETMQTGNFAAGDGAYAYMDAGKDLKTVIELLVRKEED